MSRLEEIVARPARAALDFARRINRPVFSDNPTVMWVIAGVLITVAVFSWIRLDLSVGEMNWAHLALSAALVPASVLLTALEYVVIGSVNGVRVPLRDALRVTVAGAVANLLPLPGAVMVRVNDLTARYGRAKGALGATAAAGLVWVGWALVVAGAALAILETPWLGAVLMAGGVTLIALSWGVVRLTTAREGEWLVRASVVEVTSLVVGALRLWLTFSALGITVTVVQTGVLVASGAVASTVGIVPGGLGIRELIAGLLAPLVAVAPAAAVLSVAVMRAVGLAVQAPMAMATTRGSSHAVSSDGGEQN